MARRAPHDPHSSLEQLLAASEAICEQSETVLGWARSGRQEVPSTAQSPAIPPTPRPTRASRPVRTSRPEMALRQAQRPPQSPTQSPTQRPTQRLIEVRHEAELAPAVAKFLTDQGLTVAQELCLYPTRRSRRRSVADLAGLVPDGDAIGRRMKLEGRRVTVAEFWPALLQTLRWAPAVPFRRKHLLQRLADDPLGQSISAPRLSRYLRTLRRYGYLRRVGATTYVKRSDYVSVAAGGSLVAVELKRHSFRAALAQARSYARVVDRVWVATAGPWNPGGALADTYARFGIGALQVHRDQVRQVLKPVPGKGRDPACAPYRRILEERLVRERVLGRPRAFGQ